MRLRLMSIIMSLILIFSSLSPAFAGNSENVAKSQKTITKEELQSFIKSIPQSYLDQNPELVDTIKELEVIMTKENDI